MEFKKVFLGGLIFSLVASGLLGIFIFLFASFHEREIKILFSTLDVGACSLAGLCCSTLLSTRYKWFGIFGMIISVVCALDLLYTIWSYDPNADFDFILSLVVLAGTCSHISLILLTRASTQAVSYVLAVTVFFIAAVGGMLLLLIWKSDLGEFFYRLIGVFGILDVLGTIISPILGKTQKYEDVME